jgi:hypothetical protein
MDFRVAALSDQDVHRMIRDQRVAIACRLFTEYSVKLQERIHDVPPLVQRRMEIDAVINIAAALGFAIPVGWPLPSTFPTF